MTSKQTRRNFILSSIAVASGIAGAQAIEQQDLEIAAAPNNKAAATVKMPERLLGKTGVKLPIFGLGGAGQTPLSQPGREAEAAAQIERAIELGIRYFDTAADYGPSEANLGKVAKISIAPVLGHKNRRQRQRRRVERLRTIAQKIENRSARLVAVTSCLIPNRIRPNFQYQRSNKGDRRSQTTKNNSFFRHHRTPRTSYYCCWLTALSF